jgi:hypothetical protein
MKMLVSYLDILDIFTSDRKVSQDVLFNYNRNIHNILNLKLEEKLRVFPYVENLSSKNISIIDSLYKTDIPKELNEMCTYLFFRSKLGYLMTIHILTQAVVNRINSLFIDIFPREVPDILKNGIYIETKELILFDNISKIILYNGKSNQDTDRFGIILIKTDGTFIYSSIEHSYILGIVAEELDKVEYDGRTNNTDIIPFRKALMFCFIFAILLEAENSPASIKNTNKSNNLKKRNRENKVASNGWIEKPVYINKKYQSNNNNLIHATLYKDDKILKKVQVSGFLRYQAYGKNYSKHKYIYINSFTSYRWIIESNKKITYYLK